MYAIRSYYETGKYQIPVHADNQNFKTDKEEKDCIQHLIDELPKVIEPLPCIRITSYNVCYTKLLRQGLKVNCSMKPFEQLD